MNAGRVLQKGGIYNNVVYMIGGDDKNTIEKCDLSGAPLKWQKVDSELHKYVTGKFIESICHSQFTVNVENNIDIQM